MGNDCADRIALVLLMGCISVALRIGSRREAVANCSFRFESCLTGQTLMDFSGLALPTKL